MKHILLLIGLGLIAGATPPAMAAMADDQGSIWLPAAFGQGNGNGNGNTGSFNGNGNSGNFNGNGNSGSYQGNGNSGNFNGNGQGADCAGAMAWTEVPPGVDASEWAALATCHCLTVKRARGPCGAMLPDERSRR